MASILIFWCFRSPTGVGGAAFAPIQQEVFAKVFVGGSVARLATTVASRRSKRILSKERRSQSLRFAFCMRPFLSPSASQFAGSSCQCGSLLLMSLSSFSVCDEFVGNDGVSDDDDPFDKTTKTRGEMTTRKRQRFRWLAPECHPPQQQKQEQQQRKFKVTSTYQPTGDQPHAISQLVRNLDNGDRFVTLRGATGTGKTFVMAHLIARMQRPTLVLCHNKTLAAQLARELRNFLSLNAVELFVSYYDRFVPESYVETTGTYIAKKSVVNEEIDAMRHRATRAVLERNDVVIVASVSCIYGLGLPKEYLDASISMSVGDSDVTVGTLVESLERIQYSSPENGVDMLRGNYVVSYAGVATLITLWPPHEKNAIRITFAEDDNGNMMATSIHQASEDGKTMVSMDSVRIYPASHHILSDDGQLEKACHGIEEELSRRTDELRSLGKHVEAQRLQQRVCNDLLLLRETGFCSGQENYSRHLGGRDEGEPPETLMNYMSLRVSDEGGKGNDWLLLVDESHVTLSQLKAMYGGDQARKQRLVKHGFRLPSALDNRPLNEEEFWKCAPKSVVFVSATPSRTELNWSYHSPVEMMIRPTYVCDPTIHIRPTRNQLTDLVREIKERSRRDERTLAMALTKRDAEDLASYLVRNGGGDVKATYIHSGLSAPERCDAIKALQSGEVDCLVGVNLLREGIDLPQVSLVAILNADCEGFLRSETALLQIVGRAARNLNGEAIFYASRVTKSMQRCIDDTERRRKRQLSYNAKHGTKSQSTMGSSKMFLSIFDLLREENQGNGAPTKKVGVHDISNEHFSVTRSQSKSISKACTDLLPSKPGVYFWKDADGGVLYIGKAKKIRARVKSYLTATEASARIKAMIAKAHSVAFVVTPSDRDALLLESKLIKEHQPPYNVLLKDDVCYPYICASVGDPLPRFFAVPRRFSGDKHPLYRYFGPYTSYNELNQVLQMVEDRFDLRAKSFAARHDRGGDLDGTQKERSAYLVAFEDALREIFDDDNDGKEEGTLNSTSSQASSLRPSIRADFEQANLLFDHIDNESRDVVALSQEHLEGSTHAVVFVVQLRSGMVSGTFTYPIELPTGVKNDEDRSVALQTVLERQHYASAGEAPPGRFSFFPDEVLVEFPPSDMKALKAAIRNSRKMWEREKRCRTFNVRTVAKRGPRKDPDQRAMAFAVDNANHAALQFSHQILVGNEDQTLTSPLNGTAQVGDLAQLLSLTKAPRRVECFDVSHTHGEATVGSRVVFIDGKPARNLYRTFLVQTVDGVDDYTSMSEIIERRFRRAWRQMHKRGCSELVPDGDEWCLPDLVVVDGGKGQLSAAVSGMTRASIFPWQDKNSILSAPSVEDERHFGSLDQKNQNQVAICALAKNKEKVYIYGTKEALYTFPDTPALLLLRAIRDESHRFALYRHRKRRAKQGGFA